MSTIRQQDHDYWAEALRPPGMSYPPPKPDPWTELQWLRAENANLRAMLKLLHPDEQTAKEVT